MVRYHAARAQIQALFDQARRARSTPDELRRMIADWLAVLDRETAQQDFELFGPDLSEAMAELEQELFELQAGADVTTEAHRMLVSAGWPAQPHKVGPITTRRMVPVDPPDIDHLTRRALIEHSLRRRDRLTRRPATTYDPAFAVQPVSVSLAELIRRFAADKRLSPGKATEYEALYRMLRELWGPDKPVRMIDRADCRQVRDLVSHLPPHAYKRWPHLTLAQASQYAREHNVPPMDPVTANAYLSRLSTMLKWAVREELCDRNPAIGLHVAEPEGDPRHARDPFSLDQLQRIVSHLPGLHPHRRRIILLGLFTGARLNELCGLATADIAEQEGVPIIHIRPDTGRGLKTLSARRIIPIHPLIRPAFLEYVASIDHPRLFPELAKDSRGRFSDGFQKWFGRFLYRIGATAPKTSYHSFRHLWRDACREGGVSRDAMLAMGGWKAQSTDELYGSGLSVQSLVREIEKVQYPHVDFGPLLAHPT